VLKDRQRANRLGLRGQRFFAEAIRYWYQGGEPPQFLDESIGFDDKAVLEQQLEEVVGYIGEQKISSDMASAAISTLEVSEDAYGDVDDCIRHVSKLIDAGADEIMFMCNLGGIPQDAMMETVRNIGEHVIPHFREKHSNRAAAE
jgi:hypothetical protein